jgi:hypothetical protein
MMCYLAASAPAVLGFEGLSLFLSEDSAPYYSRFLQTCLLQGFTFTFTVRIIVQFLYQDGHVRYKPTFSVFVLHVTVLVQILKQ